VTQNDDSSADFTVRFFRTLPAKEDVSARHSALSQEDWNPFSEAEKTKASFGESMGPRHRRHRL
jgi:hypothetical protein